MSTLVMPRNYKEIGLDEEKRYSGGSAVGVILATYKVVNFVVCNWVTISTIAGNASTLIGYANSWKSANGRYQMKATFVPGGSSNIYPPHSYQGAVGYWNYYPVWIGN
ncbi:hypothetical protein [Faecalitalea cylindroides]|uniref:Uncharacterized protein n=1 Tax=Faecalitalea cylindroides ATCC 27803 TaxID=649755 RepID=U2PRQ9_9FIRM|nr:hypothetical protein [Faecalitalea cylindroides]ERK46811.1 hypothetical protein HMPREF0367_00360 [[Eubacterium] cylindroides ATCC 27803] [Faecalitalea cylindroides ATCC 27803]